MHHKKSEIQEIIAGCKKQKRNSQHQLYRLYYSYGMRVCIRYTRDEDEAIHVLNDGFLKVFRNIKKFDPHKAFEPWFRKILVHTAIDHLKKMQKFKKEVSMEEAKNVSSREDVLSQLSYKELLNMVQSLSLAYRTVFNMYVIDGFNHKEIADKLGISVSTSKSNLTRARAKLKELVLNKINNRYV